VNHPRRSGYSLLELLAVLAILGLVLALALPALPGWSTRRPSRRRPTTSSSSSRRPGPRHPPPGRRRREVGLRKRRHRPDDVRGRKRQRGPLRRHPEGKDRLVAGPHWMRGKYPHVTFSFLPGFAAPDRRGRRSGPRRPDPVRPLRHLHLHAGGPRLARLGLPLGQRRKAVRRPRHAGERPDSGPRLAPGAADVDPADLSARSASRSRFGEPRSNQTPSSGTR